MIVCRALQNPTAHKLYPVRVKVLNAVAGEEQWYTVAYVPQIPTEKGSGGAERSRQRRMAVPQRVLYLTFQSLIDVSHTGVPFAAGELGELRAFPRILLYICDQPEERAVLCLKSGMCQMPCSSCDVHVSDMASEAALRARSREPLVTVERQLEAHGHRAHGRESQRRAFIEKTYSVNSQPPALAAMGGMCSPPFLLHHMIAFDVLHVSSSFPSPWAVQCVRNGGLGRPSCAQTDNVSAALCFRPLEHLFLFAQVLDLGVTRLLVQRLVHGFPSMCVGREARFGSLTATYGEVFGRLAFLGRRSRASRVAPGYVLACAFSIRIGVLAGCV